MSEKKELTLNVVEWTNPLTGDGEYCKVACTVDFYEDGGVDDVVLVSVEWNRTGEDCALRYIESEVKKELIQGICQQIDEGDFDEELQRGDYAPEAEDEAGASD